MTVDRRGLSDEQFLRDLKHAYFVTRKVMDNCVMNGAVHAFGAEYMERPTFEQRGAYKDDGDLFVRWDHDSPVLRYEVKWRNLNFTGPHDYPHPTIFVDEVENMNTKGVRPDVYIITNKDVTHAVKIKVDGAPLSIENHWDKRYHTFIDSYSVPRSYATGLVIESWV
jgi:hypothetical protein